MSDSKTKKIVNTDNRSMALDHMTVANAARALGSKTAHLSVAGATTRLSNVTTPAGQTARQTQASATNVAPVVISSSKKK
jgi:hypothetical protein